MQEGAVAACPDAAALHPDGLGCSFVWTALVSATCGHSPSFLMGME
jgi:hypothetical protein